LADPHWAVLGSGHIVNDPLNQGHGGVLAFNNLGSGGDVFSTVMPGAAILFLSFDYLSLGNQGSTGGYIGVDQPSELWITGDPGGGPPLQGISTGVWHHIDIQFNSTGSPLDLKLEQYAGGSSPPNTAFFDNIGLSDTGFVNFAPEPMSFGLIGIGLAGLGLVRRQRRG